MERIGCGDALMQTGKMFNGYWRPRSFFVDSAFFICSYTSELHPGLILAMPWRVINKVPTPDAQEPSFDSAPRLEAFVLGNEPTDEGIGGGHTKLFWDRVLVAKLGPAENTSSVGRFCIRC